MPAHAIIVGAGIAGPLAAIALQKAGLSASVYEAYPHTAPLAVGAWLTVAVNGLDAMATLGLSDAVKACGFPSDTIEICSGSGRRLGAVPIGGRLADGTVTHTMKRADLSACIARAAVHRGIPIAYDKRLVEVAEWDGRIVARFADGSETAGDVLVGADGVHSVVRRLIDPGAPGPRYTGLGNIGGFAPGGPDSLRPHTYRMVFGKRAFFGYTVAPSGEVWWFANPPHQRELTRDELAGTDWRARLAHLLADDEGPMLEIVRSTPGPLVAANQYDLLHVPRWRRGRMILIGDAAHAASPSSGQGVSMAAEDAVALAAHLHCAADLDAGLAAFERARRARVERVVAYGKRYAKAKIAGPAGRFVRDLVLPVIFRLQARAGAGSLGWLFNHHIEWPARGADGATP